MKIVVAGGGSGGHITPILAVVSALKSPDREIHYIGIGQKRERELVSTAGVERHRIMAGKFRRYHGRSWGSRLTDWRTPLLNLRDSFLIGVGVIQSLWLLLRIRPACVFIKGGYVGLPIGLAAFILRTPFLIHESDSTPGLANRLLARLTPHRVSGFDIEGYENVGNPVRPEIMQPSVYSRQDFDISSSQPVVLVFGGSLGAHALNEVVVDLARAHEEYEIIHLTGDAHKDTAALDVKHYHAYPFLSDKMPAALQLADVVIARAGANTLAELAALKKPSIIIPHPNLTSNHQYKNAQAMSEAEAVLMIEQDDITVERLSKAINKLVDDQYARLYATRIGQFAYPESATRIAEKLLSIGERKR